MPIGIYDFTNHLVTTITSDPNGVYEVLLPSTYSINCPTPSGVCPSMYYILGNDPGQPGQLNPNYNPQYRTIGASFEIYPGVMVPSDLAPTQIVPGVLAGGTQYSTPPQCFLDDRDAAALCRLASLRAPELECGQSSVHDRRPGLRGYPGPGAARRRAAAARSPVGRDRVIAVTVPATVPTGVHQLGIRTAAGNGTDQRPELPRHRRRLQPAWCTKWVRAAPMPRSRPASMPPPMPTATATRVVVVYPGTPALWNPNGTYFENVLIYSPLKLQGVGPGGVHADGSSVSGSVIDGARRCRRHGVRRPHGATSSRA